MCNECGCAVVVEYGSRVTIRRIGGLVPRTETFTPARAGSCDFARGERPDSSPLVRDVLGHRVDDDVTEDSPAGPLLWRIVAIEPPADDT